MNNPIVVLMSVYNSVQFLRKSLSSILSQNFRNFKFIIINDGSTNKTQKIVKNFSISDKRIKLSSKKIPG
jgi:glycosyltransferase involved in cell wall biosynthesis